MRESFESLIVARDIEKDRWKKGDGEREIEKEIQEKRDRERKIGKESARERQRIMPRRYQEPWVSRVIVTSSIIFDFHTRL